MSQIEVIGPKGLRKSKYDFGNLHVSSKYLEQAIGVGIGKLITEFKLTKLLVKVNPFLICVDNYSIRKTVDSFNYDDARCLNL